MLWPWSLPSCILPDAQHASTAFGPTYLVQTMFAWNDARHGKFVREIAYLPLAEDIPVAFNSCRKGPRSLGWRDDKPAELYWAEAQVRSSPRHPWCPQSTLLVVAGEIRD